MNDTLLWTPSPERVAASHMTRYMKWLEARHGLRFDDYDALWQWSVNSVEDFWVSIWEYFDVRGRVPYTRVLDSHKIPGARWFTGARLNIIEHVFRWHTGEEGDRTAVIGSSELRPVQHLSWNELRRQVAAVAHALRELGVEPGDRVAACLPNVPEAVVAFCACASIGAIWSSCSPDMSTPGVVDRFRQISPKLLIVVDGYRSGANNVDRRDAIGQLRSLLPSVRQVVSLPYLFADHVPAGTVPWQRLLDHDAPMVFESLPFEHPLWIVHASGRAGTPTPIVHGHGGILLEQLKSHGLARGLGEDDRFMWFTTTGCVTWNVQVCALLVGSTICLHEGSPDYPDLGVLWRLIAGQRLTAFGVRAAFHVRCMEANIEHSRAGDLSALRLVASSGSLPPQTHEWIRAQLGPEVILHSGSVRADIASDFAGGCDLLPLYADEMPCRNLGVAVHAFKAGKPVVDQVGELVVTVPMPSMPLYFWGDADGMRYRESYFKTYPGFWHHGELLRITPRGGAIIHGQSHRAGDQRSDSENLDCALAGNSGA